MCTVKSGDQISASRRLGATFLRHSSRTSPRNLRPAAHLHDRDTHDPLSVPHIRPVVAVTMAKKKSRIINVRLISMAMTGFFYNFKRPRVAPPMGMLKYDPIGSSRPHGPPALHLHASHTDADFLSSAQKGPFLGIEKENQMISSTLRRRPNIPNHDFPASRTRRRHWVTWRLTEALYN